MKIIATAVLGFSLQCSDPKTTIVLKQTQTESSSTFAKLFSQVATVAQMAATKVLMVFATRRYDAIKTQLQASLREALDAHGALTSGRFVVAPSVTVDEGCILDVEPLLELEKPVVVHIVAHGRSESPDVMAAAFRRKGVRIVVLMGAGTHWHAAAIADQCVPVVYGHSAALDENLDLVSLPDTMVNWTEGFYETLGRLPDMQRDDLILATREASRRANVDRCMPGGVFAMKQYHHTFELLAALIDDDNDALADLLKYKDASVESNEVLHNACAMGRVRPVALLLADEHVRASAPDLDAMKRIALFHGYEEVALLLEQFTQDQ